MIHIVYISDYIYILYKNSFYSHNNHRSLLLLLCVLYVRENQGTEGSSNLLIVTQLWSCRPGIPNPRICIPEPRFWSRMLHPSLNKATYSIQKKISHLWQKKEKFAGSKVGAFGKLVIFSNTCVYVATLLPLLNGMFALLEVGIVI